MVNYATAGDALPVIRRRVTRESIDAYRQASGDDNRIHYDDEFADATRFGGVIAHGMLTLALVSEMLTKAYGTDWLASGNLRVRFRGAAYPGDTLESQGTVTAVDAGEVVAGEVNTAEVNTERSDTVITCGVEVRNAKNGDRIITGTASLRVGIMRQGATRQ